MIKKIVLAEFRNVFVFGGGPPSERHAQVTKMFLETRG